MRWSGLCTTIVSVFLHWQMKSILIVRPGINSRAGLCAAELRSPSTPSWRLCMDPLTSCISGSMTGASTRHQLKLKGTTREEIQWATASSTSTASTSPLSWGQLWRRGFGGGVEEGTEGGRDRHRERRERDGIGRERERGVREAGERERAMEGLGPWWEQAGIPILANCFVGRLPKEWMKGWTAMWRETRWSHLPL